MVAVTHYWCSVLCFLPSMIGARNYFVPCHCSKFLPKATIVITSGLVLGKRKDDFKKQWRDCFALDDGFLAIANLAASCWSNELN